MIEHDVAPSQPLSIPRSKRWIPPSRYYGDRYARTLEEAFGPYSQWEPEPPTTWEYARGYVLAALVAAVICAISVMVQP